MSDAPNLYSRRAALSRGALALAGIAVTVIGVRPALAKARSKKEEFFYQETPDEDTGHKCTGCINLIPKSEGKYGADSGDCVLLKGEGDVCGHCYCQGWTDKAAPGSKRADAK